MIQVEISEDFDPLPKLIPSEMSECISKIFSDHEKTDGSVHLIIVSDDILRKMKKQYFGLDVYTDVMTFNLEENGETTEGEIYVSWERVVENSKSFSVNIEHEFRRVIIHGTLHLLGYEDQSIIQKSRMTDLENKYLTQTNSFFHF